MTAARAAMTTARRMRGLALRFMNPFYARAGLLFWREPFPYNPRTMAQNDGPWTVRRTLEWTTSFFTRKGVDAPRLSSELLLAHILGVARIKLYTDYERPLTDADRGKLRDLVARGGEHEPIAYLTGRAHFFNLEFEVTR